MFSVLRVILSGLETVVYECDFVIRGNCDPRQIAEKWHDPDDGNKLLDDRKKSS
jgi:hypothetical protein